MQYYSQYNQDKFLHENYFKDFKNGIFVDVGAHDGKTINNTLFFEEQYNWTGINIEPISDVFNELIKNRPLCINLNCAVDSVDGTTEFILNTGYTEMLSGIKSHYDNRHFNRVNKEINERGGSTTIINVKTNRLETIFDNNNIKHVHYLSIDVEGGEYAVLSSINFDKVFIDIIGFENNYPDSSSNILKLLESKGYIIINENKSCDIMMIHKDSLFYKK
jgi:FkbM family methyltransferase